MKKNIIIYGGAFNPPTLAHLSITKACLKEAKKLKAEVWLLPSGDRTDKFIGVTKNQRLCYLRGLIKAAGGKNIQIELTELERSVLTETAQTVKRLERAYPNYNFIWVFGADSILTMRQWHKGAKLWEKLEILIIPREGYSLKEVPPKATTLNIKPPVMSSTEARAKIATGGDLSTIIPIEIMSCLL